MAADSNRQMDDDAFAASSLEGGATRRASDLQAFRGGEDTGYAVGGKSTPDGERIPEQYVPVDEFGPATASRHMEFIRGKFGDDPTLHQGSWRETDEATGQDRVVLDASDVLPSRSQARLLGLIRGERAIFDMKNFEDVNLPRRAVK